MDNTWRNVWFSGDVGQLDASALFDGGISARHTLSSIVNVSGRPGRCLSSTSRNWVNMELVDTAYSVSGYCVILGTPAFKR